MKRKSVCLLFVMILFTKVVCAQIIDSMLSVYSDSFQHEKVHLHFDRDVYTAGETIWFKAYILAGMLPSTYSKNLYIDIFDDKGSLLSHTVNPIFESTARGQYLIPANYNAKQLIVSAYTQWMLNFDSAFIYTKTIDIVATKVSPQHSFNNPAIGNVSRSTQTPKTTPIPSITTLQFLPEGGDCVNDITSRIAFISTNEYGEPVRIAGDILNSKKEKISSIKSVHDGMGSFSFTPQASDNCVCVWNDEQNKQHETPLPIAQLIGATLSLQVANEKVLFTITRSQNAGDNLKSLNLVATLQQNEVYRSKLNLHNKTLIASNIPTVGLPSGVLQVTLFDANWKPIAERVVFVNNDNYQFYPELNVAIQNLQVRGRNLIEINIPDSIASNISVSITDGDLWMDSSRNIISQLLLQSDVKGKIYKPAYYFSSNADSVSKHLDLVMLTHGWRRFNWDKLLQAQTPELKHEKEQNYLQIKGRVFVPQSVRIAAGTFISLILQAKDSSSKNHKQLLILPVNSSGLFSQSGVLFFDTVKAYYQISGPNAQVSNVGSVDIQNGLLPYPDRQLAPFLVTPLLYNYKNLDSVTIEKTQHFYENYGRLARATEDVLEAVTVHTKEKIEVSATELLDTKYTSGLFQGGNSHSFDVINDPLGKGAIDVFTYLQGRVAGLQINTATQPPSFSWRGGTPSLFLNEVKTDVSMLQNLPMSDVAYIKVFSPPFFGSIGGGAGGAIAVYTRKGGDEQQNKATTKLSSTLLPGYTTYKEFYNPMYQDQSNTKIDLRTTLYWNPYMLFDKKNKLQHINFYNNDISKRFLIVIEGMNQQGKIVRYEQRIE